MKSKKILGGVITVIAALNLGACAKSAPAPVVAETEVEAEPAPAVAPLAPVSENTESVYVEGVAGGAMLQTVTLEAEVVSVDQEQRTVILRGPEGKEVSVRVGKDAVNFYQVAAGDRVNVAMARELVIYVADDGEAESDGTAAIAVGAEEGQRPAGAVVASSKVTAKITAIDTDARTATVSFEDGEEETFNVRPDVDMSKYSVGQEVVFLITEMLALEVKKL